LITPAQGSKEKVDVGLVVLAIRLFLASVLGLAGVAKLFDPDGSRDAVRSFGIPNVLARTVGIALPTAELLIAALLIPLSTAWWGSIAASILLTAFLSAIGISLAKGQAPQCHCFGQIHSEPVSWSTFARTAALAVCAALAAVMGPGEFSVSFFAPIFWSNRWTLIVVCLFTLAAFQAWLLLQLMRQHGRLLLRLDALEQIVAPQGRVSHSDAAIPNGLPLGTPAPDFELPEAGGSVVRLKDLLDGRSPLMLLFSDPSCGPCMKLAPKVARWQRQFAADLRIAIISRRLSGAQRADVTHAGLRGVLLQEQREVAELYQVAGTPSAVLIRSDGAIGSAVAAGSDAIEQLVQSVRIERVTPTVVHSATAELGGFA
jgi:uncharacterized membrane protein YphA (DoxX/SURF4 family)/peroxiredoxin